jgi:hypothetical protein
MNGASAAINAINGGLLNGEEMEREREGEMAERLRRREASGRDQGHRSAAQRFGRAVQPGQSGRGAGATTSREEDEGALTGGPHASVREGGGGAAVGPWWADWPVRVSVFLLLFYSI